jgi:hypothetical protein
MKENKYMKTITKFIYPTFAAFAATTLALVVVALAMGPLLQRRKLQYSRGPSLRMVQKRIAQPGTREAGSLPGYSGAAARWTWLAAI